jgi:4-amino-4-deoxy-L-arabinose transferase-like glycosyltransferase
MMGLTVWMVAPRLIAFAVIGYTAFFIILYFRLERARKGSLEWIDRRQKPRMEFTRHTLGKKDILPVAIITAAYAAVAFFNLGDTAAPQSFHRFEKYDDPVLIELRHPAQITRIFYYTGLGHGGGEKGKKAYRLEFSPDGVNWWPGRHNSEQGEFHLSQGNDNTFRWLNASVAEQPDITQFIRISIPYLHGAPIELGELAIFTSKSGEAFLSASDIIVHGKGGALFDEQDVIPARYDILNSSHFDEIYHAYTAYQHTRGLYRLEWTHPPLGKLITASGISVFGMTPFGWRFMPTLFGVLMVPLFFVLLKWMFGKTRVAVCGTLLFAFDFMHFVQTRISTIDVYAVFFILCMYLFMYRYLTTGHDTSFWKTSLPLIFAGLAFGVGAASKWVCIYAGAGLFAYFCICLYRRARYCRKEEKSFMPFFFGTGVVALFAFILIPGVIYVACYIPYALTNPAREIEGFGGLIGASWAEFWKNQQDMYKYHAKDVLDAIHPYTSRWYEWLVNWRPIWYYGNSIWEEGTRASIWAFTNPLTTWAGLGAVVICAAGIFRRRSHTALFIVIGYLSQLLPWIPVSRITFPYHYFPSMIFVCLAVAWVFDRMDERSSKTGTRHMVIFTAAATALFALFYPVLTGLQMPVWYPTNLLQWLPRWPF